MDSFEVNKIIGALLGVIFVIFSVSLLSDAIFASPAPEKPGYAIEAMEGAGGGEAPKAEVVEDIRPMLAKADPDKGAAIFKRCEACHTDDQSGANKVGPNLWGVVGRPIASHEGFSYSAALKEFSEGGKKHWDYDLLNHFIHGPKKFVPGTAMGFAGLPKAEDRANVIAYLRTQADTPAPLPTDEELAKIEADKKGGDEANAAGAKAAAPADKGPAAPADKGAAAPADKGAAAPADKGGAAAPAGDKAAAPAEKNGEAAPAGGNANGGASDQGAASGNGNAGASQPADQNVPATPSSTTEPGTSGAAPAEPNAQSGDQPGAQNPADAETGGATESDSTPRKQDEGSTDKQ